MNAWADTNPATLRISIDTKATVHVGEYSRGGQFLYRIAGFADSTGLVIRLIYYPPYHSKYNAIERYWAGLEKSWNGFLLDSVATGLNRAGNFVWRGMQATARFLDVVYEKGVKLCGKEKNDLESRLLRSLDLHWWDIAIYPKMV